MPESDARNEQRRAVEAMLFAAERPLKVDEIRSAFDPSLDARLVQELLGELKAEYASERRGFQLYEIAGGHQVVTDSRFEPELKRLYQSRVKKRLSQATLETLSIIAYRQPVTRADIEFVRGVNADAALNTLLERNLVKIAGRKDVPGRPMLYGTTQDFLEHFGLNSLADLPPLSQFTEKDIDPSLLPASLREGAPAGGEAAPGAETETGQQRPIGCSNEEEGGKE